MDGGVAQGLGRDVVAKNLSVRETEALVKKAAAPEQKREEPQKDVHTRAAEDRLRFALGTRVRIGKTILELRK